MAVNRLFLMVYLLLEKGTMTAPEIAEHFEVSVRTVYRDVDLLSAAGIPIYATQGKGGGIAIPDQFTLNKSLLSEEEQNQILMALEGLGMVDKEQTDPVLSKLSSVFRKQNTSWIEIDFSDWNRNCDSTFHCLKQAIFQSRKVAFTYYRTNMQPSERIVEPLKLVFKSRDWYLYGYCCRRQENRLFKLTRIKALSITDQTFSRTAPERIFEQTSPHQEPLLPVTLLFDKDMGYRVYDHFDPIQETEDGCFLVETALPDNEWLYTFLLSFGSKVTVLHPSFLREEMEGRIRLMLKNYIT